MHELSIAESILHAVRKEMRAHPDNRPLRVGVRVGRMSAIDPDSLSFSFSILVTDSEWPGLKLEIMQSPATRKCRDCGHTFVMTGYHYDCPECASGDTLTTGGDELDIEYLELENDATPAPQVESTE
jgi:hydrogenase nickel incorporation protein HypA/HybF